MYEQMYTQKVGGKNYQNSINVGQNSQETKNARKLAGFRY